MGHAPPYDDVIMGGASGSIYSVNLPVQPCEPGALINTPWCSSRKEGLSGVMIEGMSPDGVVLLGRCEAQGCEDCEREIDQIKDIMEKQGGEEDDEMC